MTPPDWKTCDEGELWRFVEWHLEGAGIPTVLVGGAVVAIYSEGLYRSGDLDMVLDRHRQSDVTEIPVEGRILRLLSPTDCVKDRLAAYIHWRLRDNFRQAVLVARRQKDCIDFENLAAWCDREGGAVAYEKLLEELSKAGPP